MNNIKTQDKVAIVLLFGAILILLSVLFMNNRNNHIRIDEIKTKVTVNPYENIKLSAKAAIVWDMKNKRIIFGKNVLEPLPLASLTKAMTALTAVELIPSYTVITISKQFLAEEGDSGLLLNEKWNLKDLLAVSLLSSSNDGMAAIASVAGASISSKGPLEMPTDATILQKFIDEMNKKAESIGMNNTYFENENGLDKENAEKKPIESSANGSAHDVALLFDYIMSHHPDLLEATRYKELSINSLENTKHDVNNTNIVVDQIPGILASKTGFTDIAGGNLAIVTDLGLEGPYIVAVLGSTLDGRFEDIQTLVKATSEYVSKSK